jgi:hypothetical protein
MLLALGHPKQASQSWIIASKAAISLQMLESPVLAASVQILLENDDWAFVLSIFVPIGVLGGCGVH